MQAAPQFPFPGSGELRKAGAVLFEGRTADPPPRRRMQRARGGRGPATELSLYACARAQVFAEKTADVDNIHEYLLVKGVEAVAVHGGKDQEEREAAIDAFKVRARTACPVTRAAGAASGAGDGLACMHACKAGGRPYGAGRRMAGTRQALEGW